MKIRNLLLVISSVLTLAGCGQNTSSSTSSPSSITVSDMVGRQVEVTPGSYQRIVCIGAGALRLYSYIGDCNLLSGVEDIDNETLSQRPKMFDGVARPYFIANKDVFSTLPSCGVGGPNAQAAEAEKILSCNPDLIISEYEDSDKANALQAQVGVPVITLKVGSSGVWGENLTNTFNLLGKVLNKQSRAQELNDYIASEKQKIVNLTKDVTTKPTTYICGLGNWGTTNHLWTAQNYNSFNIANIKNAITDLTANGIQKIEEEKFVSLGSSIEVMIIDAAAVKNIKPLYKQDPTMFSSVKAWNEGEVYLQMAYNAYYTNIELALVNTWYNAKVVYPSLFEDLDIKAKTNEVTRMFNGKELADEIFNYTHSFGGYQKINTETFFA